MTDSRYSVLDTRLFKSWLIISLLHPHVAYTTPSISTLIIRLVNSITYIIQELKDININLQFIIICDTFLVESNAGLFQIPGYKCIHNCWTSISKGVWLCTWQMIFHLQNDLVINIESIRVEIKVKSNHRLGFDDCI